jgi:hypothetical protein
MQNLTAVSPNRNHREHPVWGEPFTPLRIAKLFVDFPKIKKPNTFTADQAIDKLHATVAGG